MPRRRSNADRAASIGVSVMSVTVTSVVRARLKRLAKHWDMSSSAAASKAIDAAALEEGVYDETDENTTGHSASVNRRRPNSA